jgi:hypothetical protein
MTNMQIEKEYWEKMPAAGRQYLYEQVCLDIDDDIACMYREPDASSLTAMFLVGFEHLAS